MLKRVKNVLEKLKFKFKGSDNTNISNIEKLVDEFLTTKTRVSTRLET